MEGIDYLFTRPITIIIVMSRAGRKQNNQREDVNKKAYWRNQNQMDSNQQNQQTRPTHAETLQTSQTVPGSAKPQAAKERCLNRTPPKKRNEINYPLNSKERSNRPRNLFVGNEPQKLPNIVHTVSSPCTTTSISTMTSPTSITTTTTSKQITTSTTSNFNLNKLEKRPNKNRHSAHARAHAHAQPQPMPKPKVPKPPTQVYKFENLDTMGNLSTNNTNLNTNLNTNMSQCEFDTSQCDTCHLNPYANINPYANTNPYANINPYTDFSHASSMYVIEPIIYLVGIKQISNILYELQQKTEEVRQLEIQYQQKTEEVRQLEIQYQQWQNYFKCQPSNYAV